MSLDISNLSAGELQQLRDNIESQIRERRDSEQREAKAKIREIAASVGLSVSFGEAAAAPSARSKVAPKYRNPSNAAETWSGRGKRPNWVNAALAAGKQLEDLAIA